MKSVCHPRVCCSSEKKNKKKKKKKKKNKKREKEERWDQIGRKNEREREKLYFIKKVRET